MNIYPVQSPNISGTAANAQPVKSIKYNPQANFSNISNEKNVSVTISQAGRDLLKNTDPTSFEDHIKVLENLRDISDKGVMLEGDMQIESEFRRRFITANQAAYTGSSLSEGQFADNLLSVYSGMYDEIKRGYADGTRSVYVYDSEAESGYRQLTEKEELDALDKTFNSWTEATKAFLETASHMERIEKEMESGRDDGHPAKSEDVGTEERVIGRILDKIKSARDGIKANYLSNDDTTSAPFEIKNKRTGYEPDEMYDMAEKAGLKKGVLMTDYYYVIPSKLNEMSGDTPWVTKSYEDKTKDLLGAYASIYDDIVKGYEAGTREVYVEDSESETGYRKLTMEEEISELDKAFAERTDRFKHDYEVGKKATADIAASLDRLAKAGARVDKERIESTSKALEKYSQTEITDEVAARMKDATVQIKQHLSQGGIFNASFSETLISNLFKKAED